MKLLKRIFKDFFRKPFTCDCGGTIETWSMRKGICNKCGKVTG